MGEGAKSKGFGGCYEPSAFHQRRGTPRLKNMASRIYFDWNATAPLRKEARAAALAALDLRGNPSSVHSEGRAARRLIEDARERVAALVGAQPRNVIFTSGGTEANALALTPSIGADNGSVRDRLLMSTIEHPSVRAGGRFPPPAREDLPVTRDGVVDLPWLARRLREGAGKNLLISVMLANNETGVVQPVTAVAGMAHAEGALLHVDAVQAAGK